MDMSSRNSEAVGWPFPWWGLLIGSLFLAAMFTPLAGWVGVIAVFGFAMLSIPFLAIASVAGGDSLAPMAALVGISALVLLGIAKLTVDIARARDRRTRSLLMNRLVLFVLMVAGLVVSAFALEDLWRY